MRYSRHAARVAFLAISSLLFAASVQAAPIVLDPAFGTNGLSAIPGATAAHAVALQPDGKIVVVASSTPALNLLVARLDVDGSLDATFGTGGITTTDVGAGSDDIANAVALQPDGKIVVAGSTTAGPSRDFVVARYDAGGTLDAAFGSGGITTTDILGDTDIAIGVALQADGKIVVAGEAQNSGTLDGEFAVARYDTSGTLDASYGTGGIAVTPFPGRFAGLLAMTIQADGKTVVGGRVAPDDDLALARYTTAGTLDGTFGTGGVVTTDLGSDTDRIHALAVQPDAKILALGTLRERGAKGRTIFALVRYEADGSVDPSFGDDGVVATKLSDRGDAGHALLLEPSGAIIAAGHAPFLGALGATRYAPDGSLDDGFGACGRLEVALDDAIVKDAARQSDGKLVFAASSSTGATVARVLADIDNCSPAPESNCRVPVVPFKAKLSIKDKTKDKSDKLVWSWVKGETTSSSALGQPTLDDGYSLCLYDESGPPTLISEARIPPGGECGADKPCWKQAGLVGFKYKDRDATPCGITKVQLKGGSEGKAKIKVIGKGTLLPVPSLPLALPVRVQLQGDHGECWEATYSADQFQVNTPTVFKGKAD